MTTYRHFAARAGLPAWLLIAQLSSAQDKPAEPDPPIKIPEIPEAPVDITEVIPEAPKKPKVEAPKAPEKAPVNDATELPVPEAPVPAPTGGNFSNIPGDPNSIPGLPNPSGPSDLPIPGAPGEIPSGIPGAFPELPASGADDSSAEGGDSTLLVEDDSPELTSEDDSLRPSFGGGSRGSGDRQLGGSSPADSMEELGGLPFNGGERDPETQGAVFSLGLTHNYSSNLAISEAGQLSGNWTTLSPAFSYRSAPEGGAVTVFAASYSLNYDIYHTSDFENELGHQFATSLTHEGARTELVLTGEYSQSTQSDRLTETFSENTQASLKLEMSYAVGAKTSIFTVIEYSLQDNSVSEFAGSDLFGATISAQWLYSPKLTFGPIFRYALSDSNSNGQVSSYALGMETRYDYSEKLRATASLGIEATSPESGSTDYAPTAALRLRYTPNPIWRFNARLRYEAIPIGDRSNPSFTSVAPRNGSGAIGGPSNDGNQQFNASLGVSYRPGTTWTFSADLNRRTSPSGINLGESLIDTSFSIAANREIGSGRFSARFITSLTEFEGGVGPTSREDQNFRQIGISYSYPDLLRGLDLSTDLSYGQSSGGRDYNEFGASIGFNYTF